MFQEGAKFARQQIIMYYCTSFAFGIFILRIKKYATMEGENVIAERIKYMITLGIDTANQTLAIGVVEDEQILGQIQTNIKRNHSVTLMPAIDQLFADLQISPKDIDRIAVSDGPGSYTGLRIGVTTAKTIAYTLDKELVGVSSLKTIAANCIGVDNIIVPMFDARRKNVYAGAYRWKENRLETVLEDVHISASDLFTQLQKLNEAIYFVGSDCHKFFSEIKEILPSAMINTVPAWDIPSGVTVAQLGALVEPVAEKQAFLPRYLKRVEAEEKWLETHTPGDEVMLKKFRAYARSFFQDKMIYTEKTVEQIDRRYVLRELTTEDIKELLDVEREVYNGELPWTKSAFISELKSPLPHLYLGIFDNGRMIGFIGSRAFGLDCHITNIAVRPAYQRKRIGSLLIDEIENFAIMNRCETMSLEVRMSNQDAQRLYRKLGFQATTIKKRYYTETKEDALDMIKLLENE